MTVVAKRDIEFVAERTQNRNGTSIVSEQPSGGRVRVGLSMLRGARN